tara:strand:- start:450 stop:650 length:201 start_codon:yes stop_codon:yes gene_type:complete
VVLELLRNGAMPNIEDAEGMTPLLVALDTGNAEILHALLVAGAEVQKGVYKSGMGAAVVKVSAAGE